MEIFTDVEKCILEVTNKSYKWIARDKNGCLYVYDTKPYKDEGYGYFSAKFSNGFLFNRCVSDVLFKNVTWENSPIQYRDSELLTPKDGQKHMKGYKVFHSDWTCRGFQFEVGKVFEEDVTPVCCDRGFHFCTKASDCFRYYSFDPDNKVAEVEALGDIDIQDYGSKCCTNKIYIIREITWQEVLDLVNLGKGCTGLCNSGDHNSGNRNSGDWNTGNRNTGDCNTGDCNSGNYNSGDCNSGDCNSGNYNSGDCNSGDWNRTCFSNGCFNTESPKIFLFNKPSDWTYQDWLNSYARYILMNCPSNVLSWIAEKYMTDEEKEQHPEYSVTGGFVKHIEKETGRQMWWDGLSSNDKETVMSIPNFDEDIFYKCTGIRV